MKLPFVAREALDTAEQKFAELNQEYRIFAGEMQCPGGFLFSGRQ